MNQDILDQKQAVIDEIAAKFETSVSSVVVEYRGLSVAEVTELRRALREEEVELKVYKNSMAQRACDNVGFGDLKDQLTGPNAIAFGKDAVAPARVLANFAKKHKALILKGAIVEGKVVGLDYCTGIIFITKQRRYVINVVILLTISSQKRCFSS